MQPKGLSNISFKGRLKQLIALLLAIIVCLIIAQVVDVNDIPKKAGATVKKPSASLILKAQELAS
jgi:hypothetical protein